MTLKERVNSGLVRVTGYELARPKPKRRSTAKKSAAQANRGAGANPPELSLPKDYDSEAASTIRAVKPWTMTAPDKLYALILAVRHVAKHKIPGDIVECGVWRGGSMQATARTLLEVGDTSRQLFLFDTFEGMPPPTEDDRRHDGKSAADLLATSARTAKVWAVAALDDVQQGMAQIGYPEDQIHYIRGTVEETVPHEAPEQISILRLDTDWYSSTKHELDTLYPRLVSGGVLLIDDYGWWDGAKKAVDEFLEESGEQLLLLRMASGRIALKP